MGKHLRVEMGTERPTGSQIVHEPQIEEREVGSWVLLLPSQCLQTQAASTHFHTKLERKARPAVASLDAKRGAKTFSANVIFDV